MPLQELEIEQVLVLFPELLLDSLGRHKPKDHLALGGLLALLGEDALVDVL